MKMRTTDNLYLVTRHYDFLVIEDIDAYGITKDGDAVYFDILKTNGVRYRQFFNKDLILYIGNDKQVFDQLKGGNDE